MEGRIASRIFTGDITGRTTCYFYLRQGYVSLRSLVRLFISNIMQKLYTQLIFMEAHGPRKKLLDFGGKSGSRYIWIMVMISCMGLNDTLRGRIYEFV